MYVPMDSLNDVNVASPHPFPVIVKFPENVSASGTVSSTESVLSTSYLYEIGCRYGFPRSAILAQPWEGDRAWHPPSSYVTIYEDHLVFGLRVLFLTIYADIYERYGVSPAQFTLTGSCKSPGWGWLANA